MRSIFAFLLMVSPALAADGFSTIDEYQPDFETAKECRLIDGRRLWVGREGYYIQSWLFQTGQSGLLDDEAASVVPFKDNSPEDLSDFAAACE